MDRLWTTSTAVATSLVERWPAVAVTIIAFTVLSVLHPLITRTALPKDAPKLVSGYPLLGATPFYTSRLPFLVRGRKSTKTRNFSFFLGRFSLVSVGGPEGRATIFEAKDTDLNLSDGYSLLLNGRPPLKRVENQKHTQTMAFMLKRAKTDQLTHTLPKIIKETQIRIKGIAQRLADPATKTGIFNPQEEIYSVAYAVLMCHFGANEILRDPKLMVKSQAWFQTLLGNQSVMNVIFPWLGKFIPSRTYAGIQSYRMLADLLQERVKTGKKEDDWMQELLDGGHNTKTILSLTLAALFAGTANTAITACNVPSYIITNPHWYKKLQGEIDGVISAHRVDRSQTATDILASLPLSTWEKDFPILQLCLHETLRLTALAPVYRKNTSGRDIPIGETGEVIPAESYVLLSMDEVHADETLYRDPVKWDPSRFLGDSPEGQGKYEYIAWGAGRHSCAGIRFAKLLVVIIVAHQLAAFHLEAVDEKGHLITKQPGPHKDGEFTHDIEQIRFKFKVREGSI